MTMTMRRQKQESEIVFFSGKFCPRSKKFCSRSRKVVGTASLTASVVCGAPERLCLSMRIKKLSSGLPSGDDDDEVDDADDDDAHAASSGGDRDDENMNHS